MVEGIVDMHPGAHPQRWRGWIVGISTLKGGAEHSPLLLVSLTNKVVTGISHTFKFREGCDANHSCQQEPTAMKLQQGGHYVPRQQNFFP
jgi:hypothetical protein